MSRKPSVLIVGVGSIGERHLRCFSATGRVTVSICEVNEALRRTVGDRYQTAERFGQLGEALAAKPDAVVICTPAHLHVSMARQAIGAGAHVLIEKPLSTGLEGVAELQQEARQAGRTVGVAYVYRAHPALAAVREAVQSGRFGLPVQVVANFGQHFPFYRPAYRETYYRDRATGGGAVQDALTHIINAVEWLVGPSAKLVADADHKVLEGVEVEDTVHVLTRHGAVMGAFSLNQHQAPNEGFLTIICERGTCQFRTHQSGWRWVTTPGQDWHEEPSPALERDTLFRFQAEAFLDALEGKRPVLCTLEEAVQTLRVNLGILGSLKDHRWHTIEDA